MLKGEKVRLRAFEMADSEEDYLFVSDSETILTMYKGLPFPYTRKDEQEWLGGQSGYTRGEYQFAVETLDRQYVGRCGIISMDWKNRVAELAMMIGTPYRSLGYATEAVSLLCDFCFSQLNLHRLKASVLDFNTPALRVYEHCGFREEGRLREEVFRSGAYRDVVLLGRLESEG